MSNFQNLKPSADSHVPVLNIRAFELEFVSDFGIRISNF
jgi:hypothetical protein